MELVEDKFDGFGASKASGKRKSFENAENFDAKALSNVAVLEPSSQLTKKSKGSVPDSDTDTSVPVKGSGKSTRASNKGSSLPRFQPTANNQRKAPLAALTPRNTTASGKEKVLASVRNAEPATPAKGGGVSSSSAPPPTTPRISNNPFLKKIQREILSEVTGVYLSSLFDNSFAFIDERVNTTMGTLKIKTKWDVKEKMRRQEAVVKELKDTITMIQDGIRVTKESANIFEQKVFNSIRESYDQLVDNAQTIVTLKATEKKLTKDQDSLTQEVKLLQSRLETTKNDFHNKLRDVETVALLKEKENELLRERLTESEQKHSALRQEQEKLQNETATKLEKQIDDTAKLYKSEITLLQTQLAKAESELDRFAHETAEKNLKNSTFQNELFTLKTQLYEAEQSKLTLEKENLRLQEETRVLKESVIQKDDDLRTSMHSVYVLQKQVMEEKTTLRQELTLLQSKNCELEEERRLLTAQIAQQTEKISLFTRDLTQLSEVKLTLETQLQTREMDIQQAREVMMQIEIEKELRNRSEIREESERRERIAATAQSLAIQSECTATLRQLRSETDAQISTFSQTIETLKSEVLTAQTEAKQHSDIAYGLRKEIESLHTLVQQNASVSNHETVEQLGRATGEIQLLRQQLAELSATHDHQLHADKATLTQLEEKLRVSEVQRRKLHNMVQELRGNIRVFARVRPFLPGDGYDLTNSDSMPESSIITRNDLNSLNISSFNTNNVNGEMKKEGFEFHFDKVFGPSSTQEVLFGEVAEFVQSALDGYHVCLFSYGQTGSGKTHTMNGSGDGSMRGIIPRAMEQVGLYKQELQAKGWEYTMEVTFLEIYNETIRDLLRSSSSASDANKQQQHEIKKDAQGNMYVTDLTRVPVCPEDFQQVTAILECAAQHRSTSATLMNDRSSRSHAVFTLHLKATHAMQGIELHGALNLVDLAGSERIDRSGVTGHELKEAVAINKSLSSLADVFSAIANKQAHIPFRNSKLTYLLQPALSGDGKTLMIVNLSPTVPSFPESLSSLRFANQVSQCELGKPKRRLKDMSATTASASASNSSTLMEVDPPATTSTTTIASASSSRATTPSLATKKGRTWDGVQLKGALDQVNAMKKGVGAAAGGSEVTRPKRNVKSPSIYSTK